MGRISSLMLDVRELQEPLLYAAALSPIPSERAGPLMYEGKRRCYMFLAGVMCGMRIAGLTG